MLSYLVEWNFDAVLRGFLLWRVGLSILYRRATGALFLH